MNLFLKVLSWLLPPSAWPMPSCSLQHSGVIQPHLSTLLHLSPFTWWNPSQDTGIPRALHNSRWSTNICEATAWSNKWTHNIRKSFTKEFSKWVLKDSENFIPKGGEDRNFENMEKVGSRVWWYKVAPYSEYENVRGSMRLEEKWVEGSETGRHTESTCAEWKELHVCPFSVYPRGGSSWGEDPRLPLKQHTIQALAPEVCLAQRRASDRKLGAEPGVGEGGNLVNSSFSPQISLYWTLAWVRTETDKMSQHF